jgi:hypothetical protein
VLKIEDPSTGPSNPCMRIFGIYGRIAMFQEKPKSLDFEIMP